MAKILVIDDDKQICLSSSFLSIGVNDLPEPAKIIEMQGSIHKSALRLQRLIENYLLYARLRLMEFAPDSTVRDLWQSETDVNVKNIVGPIAMYTAAKVQRKTDVRLDVGDVVIRVAAKSLHKITEELTVFRCHHLSVSYSGLCHRPLRGV